MADEQSETLKDAAAFDPKPVGILTIYERDARGFLLKNGDGKPKLLAEFPIMSMMDFPFPIANRLMRLDVDLKGKGLEDQVDAIKDRLQTICPALTAEAIDQVTPAEAIAAWEKALGLRGRPPVAGPDAEGSGTSSPLPASPSPAGPTTTSGG